MFPVSPHPSNGRLNLLFESLNQHLVGSHKRLLSFNFGDCGPLNFHWRNGYFDSLQVSFCNVYKPYSTVKILFNFRDSLIQNVEQVHFDCAILIKYDLENVLIQNCPAAIPNVRSEGCSSRTGPREQQFPIVDNEPILYLTIVKN